MNPVVCNGNKLRWKFNNIKDLTKDPVRSDKFTIGPVDWVITAIIRTVENHDCFTIYLEYASNNREDLNWICDTTSTYKVLRQCGSGKNISSDYNVCYHKNTFLAWGVPMIKFADFVSDAKGFLKNNSVIVEIDLSFRYYDFSKKIEHVTDMIVNVEDTEFHLNKWALASRAEYFQHLILNTKPNDVKNMKLDDITTKDFCLMLASFYPFFDTNLENHYITLIEVAKKYKVPSLHHKIEQYLLTDTKLEVIEKIKYAEENEYEQLMKKCVGSLKTGSEVKNLQTDERFLNLKDSTKLGIMARSVIEVCVLKCEEQDYFTILLRYDSNNSGHQNWICETKSTYTLFRQSGGGNHLSGDVKTCYNHNILLVWGIKMMKFSDLISDANGFLKNNSLIVEIDLSFRYYDFSKKIEHVTDMIVNVEDTEFHLNKWALASRAEYFQHLILNTKPNDIKNVKLDDITTKDFCLMLASFYPFFDTNLENHYISLIEVAKKYKVPSLHHKIEQYLLTDTKLEVIEKIKYAEENEYEQLMKKCIGSLKTGIEVKNLQSDERFSKLNDTTKLGIMARFLDFF
ncbi:unnamed protein product [Caenorhabditis angaria]|uniref:BTB domain-containing protein n=1 Tax=Caenorhabditis angaria TaxID=860376 RepID=A0A9P1MXE0_9PELO|nr:unnamed protein product [Caenorhabditis angaria]